MPAKDVKLDLVNETPLNSKAEVSGYFSNYYSRFTDRHFAHGLVEDHPILVFDPVAIKAGIFFPRQVGRQGVAIRDVRHASYFADEAEILLD
jgi:hypothetical protein